MLCTQAYGIAVSGSYAYVTASVSKSLVVVDISNPASPVILGSVVSSSLLDGVRETRSCERGWPRAPRHVPTPSSHPRATPVEAHLRSHSLPRTVCTQAYDLAVSGSYAYVAARFSNSLVVVDISNPASPVIRGSVVSSSLLNAARDIAVSGSYAYVTAQNSNSLVVVDISNPVSPVIRGSVVSSSLIQVRAALSYGVGRRAAPCRASTITLVPAAPPPLVRSHSLALTWSAYRLLITSPSAARTLTWRVIITPCWWWCFWTCTRPPRRRACRRRRPRRRPRRHLPLPRRPRRRPRRRP